MQKCERCGFDNSDGAEFGIPGYIWNPRIHISRRTDQTDKSYGQLDRTIIVWKSVGDSLHKAAAFHRLVTLMFKPSEKTARVRRLVCLINSCRKCKAHKNPRRLVPRQS